MSPSSWKELSFRSSVNDFWITCYRYEFNVTNWCVSSPNIQPDVRLFLYLMYIVQNAHLLLLLILWVSVMPICDVLELLVASDVKHVFSVIVHVSSLLKQLVLCHFSCLNMFLFSCIFMQLYFLISLYEARGEGRVSRLGDTLSPLGVRSGDGVVPPPQKKIDFAIQMTGFGAFWALHFAIHPHLMQKKSCTFTACLMHFIGFFYCLAGILIKLERAVEQKLDTG